MSNTLDTGIIAALGSSVSSTYPALTIGTYVAVHGIVSCEQPTCAACSQGFTHLCPAGKYGLELDGTWASYMKVAAFCVVPVPGTPESIPPGVVSAATDAILTPYHAMKAAPLVPEHTVLCLGVGGLGYNAISIAKRCFGVACVVACDVRASALEDARGAGADYAVEPADLAALVAEKGLLVDFAFDFVGNAKSFETCFSAIRIGGTIHIVGLGTTALSFNPIAGMFKECKLKMSFYGLRAELGEVLKAIAEGKLNPKVTTRPMSECAQVLEEMHEGKLKARTALIPDA